MKELQTAVRQYQHNDCSGLVVGYDKEETERIVFELKVIAHKEISSRLDTERDLLNTRKENKKLRDEVSRLNSVLNNRKAITPK